MVKSRIILLCSLIFLSISAIAHAAPTEIRLLHINDLHGFAEPHKIHGSDGLYGGVARLAGEVNELRRGRPSLLLSAGDMISGNAWANLFRGEPVIALMNLMRFDAMVVGNHEFDYGADILGELLAAARFPVLGANVKDFPYLRPYVIREMAGVRIAILGITTVDTAITTHPRNICGLRFEPAEKTLRKYIPEVRRQADIVILLSHNGFAADREIAARVPGIDVIVGGHSHTKVEKPAVVGKTIIVQAWEHGKALGVLDLAVDGGRITGYSGRLVQVTPANGVSDPTVQELVRNYRTKVAALLETVITRTETDLDGEHVRTGETNFGNLIADIVRCTAQADAAIINGGGIRTGIRRGDIRLKDIYDALPFDDYIVAMRLTGRQIREALEQGVSGPRGHGGGFPQVSGIVFTYARSAPSGKRIRRVLVAGVPLDPNKEYVVATNDFLAAGGDGYRVFAEVAASLPACNVVGGAKKSEKLVFNDTGRQLRDVVAEYLRGRSPVNPQVEGRIREIDP